MKANTELKDIELFIVPAKESGYRVMISHADDERGMPWEFVWVPPTIPPPNDKQAGWLHEAVISPDGIEIERDGRLRNLGLKR